MARRLIIYGLADPTSKEIRYVGKSMSGLLRPQRHWNLGEMSKDKNTHKVRWIKKILAKGELPSIVVLEECESEETLIAAEVSWIAKLKLTGKLTNILEGGNGFTSSSAKEYNKLIPKEALVKGGHAAAESGMLARNNLKLRRPIVAKNDATGEERWYLSASHAAADGISSRSAISNCLRPDWRCKSSKGWTFSFVQCNGNISPPHPSLLG